MTKTAQNTTKAIIATIVRATNGKRLQGAQARAAVAALVAARDAADALAFAFENVADVAMDELDKANGNMLAHEYSDLAWTLYRLADDVAVQGSRRR